MESGGDSPERHSALCNYSHWQTLKNDPGLILTPRKETSLPTAQAASGRPIIALSLLPSPESQVPKMHGGCVDTHCSLRGQTACFGKWAGRRWCLLLKWGSKRRGRGRVRETHGFG